MGGSPKAPPPPDYTPIAEANRASSAESVAAQREAQALAREQFEWGKTTYERDRAATDTVVQEFLGTMRSEAAAGAADRRRYQDVYQPLEDQMVRDAQSYASPERQELEASRASAEVAAGMEGQRRAAVTALESFGVDPSTARAGALDASLRAAQGAAQAGASNQGRLGAEATGRALTGEMVNIGRGYPGGIAQAYGTSQAAGQGAVSGQLATTASGANTMGTATQWNGAANSWGNTNNSGLNAWGGQTTSLRNNFSDNAQRSASSRNQMVGALAGAAGGALLGPAGGFSGSNLGALLNLGGSRTPPSPAPT